METVIYWLGALTLCIGVPYLTMRVVDWLDKPTLTTRKGVANDLLFDLRSDWVCCDAASQ